MKKNLEKKTKKKHFQKKLFPINVSKILIIITLLLVLMLFCNLDWEKGIFKGKKRLKIGVVGVAHGINVGNCLIKYAISIVLSKLGFEPYIIGTKFKNENMIFVNKSTNLVYIRQNFSEIKENDYDILMVNSDQTWRKFDNLYLDYGFLKFAQNWNIKKFVYGASVGYDYWTFSPEDDLIMRELLKNFTGVSVREMGSIKLIQEHLGITPEFVLDPTLLIDKQYYLNLIKDYKNNSNYKPNDYIFIYTFSNIRGEEYKINRFYKDLIKRGEKIYDYCLNNIHTIEEFIYYISNCKAVVTYSFHATVFSIIFNKPFIAFTGKGWAQERFKSLGKLLGVENRIVSYPNPNISFLTTPLNINYRLIDELRIKSINFLKRNLYRKL